MFQQNRHNAANSASSSHHQSSTNTGAAGSNNMKIGANNSGGSGGVVVKELLDRVHEEYGLLQQQLHNTRMELEKCQQERDGIQRYTIVLNETFFSAQLEMQKHIEICKRLSGILTHVVPMLPQEHQGSAVAAIERAKTIGPQELQSLFNSHMQQQQLAAMLASGPAAAAAAAFNPAMMMAGMGMNLNLKPEEAMQAVLNNIFKNPMLGASAGGGGAANLPGPGCLPMPGIPTSGHPLIPGPSSSSVPPTGGGDEGRPLTHPGRSSSVLNSTGGGSAGGSRPRSRTGTPVSYAKRTKLEPEDGDGELEIDVQNDDAGSSAALSHHTNGRTSQPLHKGHGKDTERDTASASSRDSATPRSGKLQLASTPGSSSGCPPISQMLPNNADLANFFAAYGGGRFTGNFNNQMSGLFGLPQVGGQPIPSIGALSAMVQNGTKIAAYSFKVVPGEPITPVNFPPDASLEPDVPKTMRRIGDLPHGDVVCAVTMAKDGRRVFTGGKGAVKMWDITDRLFNSTTANVSNDTSSGDDIGGNNEIASNGGGRASTEQWTPVATFPCLKDSYIRSCKLFPDASTLIVGGETKTICILDVERGEIKTTFDCEAEACYALAISQDCKLCFSCCSSGVVNVWDLQSGERITQLVGHSDGASCVDLSGDGQKLWTGGLDNTVRCWDIGAREQIDSQILESQIFSLGCCPTDNWVAVGLEDQNVQVLNSTTMGEKYLLTGHESCVLSLKFASSGKASFNYCNWFVSTGKDNVVNCWRTPYGYRLVKSKETSSVLSCDISDDDRFLLTGSGDKKASLYELSF